MHNSPNHNFHSPFRQIVLLMSDNRASFCSPAYKLSPQQDVAVVSLYTSSDPLHESQQKRPPQCSFLLAHALCDAASQHTESMPCAVECGSLRQDCPVVVLARHTRCTTGASDSVCAIHAVEYTNCRTSKATVVPDIRLPVPYHSREAAHVHRASSASDTLVSILCAFVCLIVHVVAK